MCEDRERPLSPRNSVDFALLDHKQMGADEASQAVVTAAASSLSAKAASTS
jgi:hypothetical protein